MAIQMQIQSFSHLEFMVSKPTWKDVLLELITSNRIDPWNLDIVELADAFIKRVREMERMDFALQANVILAASILLKYKSNYLKMLSYQADLHEFQHDEVGGAPDGVEDIPQLVLSSRIPPRRQITLDELLGEMERIIKYDQVERIHIPKGTITEIVDMELPDRDIDKDMEEILTKIKEHTDHEGWSLFSKIVTGCDARQTIYYLLCVLHMVQLGSIDIKQDKLFEEVFIQLLER